jgi:hypothetical protein
MTTDKLSHPLGPTLEERESQARIKEAQLKLKEQALEIRQAELDMRAKGRLNAPFVLTFFGFLATAIGGMTSYWSSLSVERTKMQSTLVVEAIKTADPQTAGKNLNFLCKMRYLDAGRCEELQNYLLANVAPTLPILPPPLRVKIMDSKGVEIPNTEIEVVDGSRCLTGLDGFSICPTAIGNTITLRKPGYGERGPFLNTEQTIRFDPGNH